MAKKVVVEVLGSEPPCYKCRKTYEVLVEAVKELGVKDRVEVVKVNAMSPDIISKYGLVITPTVAVNGEIKILGKMLGSKRKAIEIIKEVLD